MSNGTAIIPENSLLFITGDAIIVISLPKVSGSLEKTGSEIFASRFFDSDKIFPF